MGEKRVLLVARSRAAAKIADVHLRAGQRDVAAVWGGEAGLAKAQAEHPNAILLDPWLPDMDGAEFVRRLRGDALTRHLPVVLLTDAAHVARLLMEQGTPERAAWKLATFLNRAFDPRAARRLAAAGQWCASGSLEEALGLSGADRTRTVPLTILVVCGEPQIVRLVRANLGRAGYRVLRATSGAEALAAARRDRPDVVLVGTLPDAAGLELSLRSDPSTAGIPVVRMG